MQKGNASCLWASLLVLFGSSNCVAADSFLANPVGKAIREGDCDKAGDALNAARHEPNAANAFSLFVGARMLDEGICTNSDPAEASKYYERSGQLGVAQAQLEFAAKIGMGQGSPQDYATAGSVCRTAGVDGEGKVSDYSLGYACTVSAVAGHLLRVTLPVGSFRLPTQPAIVEFDVTDSKVRIVSTPVAQHGVQLTDSRIPLALVVPQTAFPKAFHDAMTVVPKPDANRLSPASVRLPLDLDITLERGTAVVIHSPVIQVVPWTVAPGRSVNVP